VKSIMESDGNTLIQIGAIVLMVFIIAGFWSSGKKSNDGLVDESGVETPIKEMVKPECLRGEQ